MLDFTMDGEAKKHCKQLFANAVPNRAVGMTFTQRKHKKELTVFLWEGVVDGTYNAADGRYGQRWLSAGLGG